MSFFDKLVPDAKSQHLQALLSLKSVPGVKLGGKGAKNRATARRTASEKRRENGRNAGSFPAFFARSQFALFPTI